jgi:hypothetical protein
VKRFNPEVGLLILAAVCMFIVCQWLQSSFLEPRRDMLLGRRTALPRALLHVGEYTAERAAGEEPPFVPGENRVDMADLPSRVTALSMGGLRGFLAIYLWIDAENSKNIRVHEDLLDKYHRIANLQPDYTSVWNFHAWNQAWNLSVQWSDPERRWEWIRHGIEFLREGIRRNPRSVDLMETMGRIYQERIGENLNPVDRAYFTQRVIDEEGDHPLKIAHKWHRLARLMQDETGESHSLFSKKVLHQRSAFAAHEYTKGLTFKAIKELLHAVELQQQGQSTNAAERLAEGRRQLAFARRWWGRTIHEWQRQLTQYPDDFNASLYVDGARKARGEVDDLLRRMTPEALVRQAEDLMVLGRSALSHEMLVAQSMYDEDGPEEFHGPPLPVERK